MRPAVCIACGWSGNAPDAGCPNCGRDASLRFRLDGERPTDAERLEAAAQAAAKQAQVWVDRGIGMCVQATLAFARGVEQANTAADPGLARSADTLRILAGMLGQLKGGEGRNGGG